MKKQRPLAFIVALLLASLSLNIVLLSSESKYASDAFSKKELLFQTSLLTSEVTSSTTNTNNKTANWSQLKPEDPQESNTNGSTKRFLGTNNVSNLVVIKISNYTEENYNDLFFPMSSGFCQYVKHAQDSLQFTNQSYELRFQIKVNCQELFRRNKQGTGNWLLFFYGMRKVALAQGRSSIQFECSDIGNDTSSARTVLLPWLSGFYPKSSLFNFSFSKVCEPSYDQFDMIPLIPIIKADLQKMALCLIGVPRDSQHPSVKFSSFYENLSNFVHGVQYGIKCNPEFPMLPNVELDDVVIHFRCGDVFNANLICYGFYKYEYYSRYISPEATTLGIVTQPFKTSKNLQTRKEDNINVHGKGCEAIVKDLVTYIKQKHPSLQRITIRNGSSETVALTIARMIMAKQLIASASSFSMIPSLATFGTGYIPQNSNGWLFNSFFRNPENLNWVEDHNNIYPNKLWLVWPGEFLPSLGLLDAWNRSQTDVLKWFKDN